MSIDALVAAAIEYDKETNAAFPSEVRIRLAREKLDSAAYDYVEVKYELNEEYPGD
jgi:hypothetical protein